ncbi:hypothetical protein [Priestia koreensis]|nr:hypothetical protein [Priestia koreensis]MCM3005846.1 hypothetical protein [Priestia koreensis]
MFKFIIILVILIFFSEHLLYYGGKVLRKAGDLALWALRWLINSLQRKL